jgi:hypothetical protein
MADVKLVVIYPHTKDVEVFGKVYQQEHAPLAIAKLSGSPQGVLPSITSPKYIFRRCKLWKHARLLKVARRCSLTR